MKILIETIPHESQRYDTCGDWTFNEIGDEGILHIKVSSLDNWKYEALVGIHEAIEAIICDARGISEFDITDFDINYIGKGEPGDNKHAPYRKEHKFATKIERMLAKQLGVTWNKYDKAINNL